MQSLLMRHLMENEIHTVHRGAFADLTSMERLSTRSTSTKCPPPHSTCKGVIRGIAPSNGPEELDRKVVDSKNPLGLEPKRIKNAGAVVVVFDGYKVPNYVTYSGTLVMYETVFRRCGVANPDGEYKRDPKGRLCDERHLTTAKECKERFQTPYLVRCRCGKRSGDNRSKSPAFAKDDRQFPAHASRSGACGSSISRSPSPPFGSRANKHKRKSSLTWAIRPVAAAKQDPLGAHATRCQSKLGTSR
ncbi:hypothetical protein HPB52_017969 [Rhipicephalus sanguineus]|uniref:Uncharacterized protein n=1 Tax=Rhipicephalus sanguineus TaxID=34632 RepID=A0A9D4TB66_RHISA|nr:hypothetical protein HPB52_017969 [Rhipicephalus sanguineus]